MSLDLVNSALLLRETTLTNLPYAVGATNITVADSSEFAENFIAGRHFHLVVWDKNAGGSPRSAKVAGKLEIVKATLEPVSNSIDIERGQEGTTPIEFSSGGDWQVSLMFTPETLKALVPKSSIVNDLTTGGATNVASAETVKDLKTQLDAKGKLLQTVQATHSSVVSISTTTPTDSGLTASITPLKTTSKIRVSTFQPFRAFGSDIGLRFAIDLLRGSTVILEETPAIQVGDSAASHVLAGSSTFSIEDNPTIPDPPVAITYKTQAYRTADNPTINMNADRSGLALTSVIILEEIEA